MMSSTSPREAECAVGKIKQLVIVDNCGLPRSVRIVVKQACIVEQGAEFLPVRGGQNFSGRSFTLLAKTDERP